MSHSRLEIFNGVFRSDLYRASLLLGLWITASIYQVSRIPRPLPGLSEVGQHFLDELVQYIVKNDLRCGACSMSELILDHVTAMLDL